MTARFEAGRTELQNTLNERDQRLVEANQRTMEAERQLVDARAEIDRATEANNTFQVLTFSLVLIPFPLLFTLSLTPSFFCLCRKR